MRPILAITAAITGGILLASCDTVDHDAAREKALSACALLGTDGSNTDPDPNTPTDWTEITKQTSDAADLAAAAAVIDPRWNRLSDAASAGYVVANDAATQQRSGIDPALTPDESSKLQNVLAVADAECRKARAR